MSFLKKKDSNSFWNSKKRSFSPDNLNSTQSLSAMLSSQRNNKGNSSQFLGSKAIKGFLLTGIFLLIFFHGLHSQSISVSGTSSVTTIIKNVQTAVDPGLLVTSDENITNFTVTIIDSYQSGDALGYTGSLPSGVTASSFNTATKSIVFT